jgi:hypothetical protein
VRVDAPRLIDRLEAFAAGLPALVDGVKAEDARFRPPSGAWSILEIVCHLVDEEIRDFRTRVEMTLRDPSLEWPAIHPSQWAVEERYNERVLAESVRRFVEERRASIVWLRGLRNPDWTRSRVHPKAGPLSAGMLLGAWAAHDALHIRQIAKRLYELAAKDCGESVGYAGEWGA